MCADGSARAHGSIRVRPRGLKVANGPNARKCARGAADVPRQFCLLRTTTAVMRNCWLPGVDAIQKFRDWLMVWHCELGKPLSIRQFSATKPPKTGLIVTPVMSIILFGSG